MAPGGRFSQAQETACARPRDGVCLRRPRTMKEAGKPGSWSGALRMNGYVYRGGFRLGSVISPLGDF